MYCKREVELGAGWEAGSYDIFTRGGADEAGNHTSTAASTSIHYTTPLHDNTRKPQVHKTAQFYHVVKLDPKVEHCLGQTS